MVTHINNLGTRLPTRVTVLYFIQPWASRKITRLIPIFYQTRHYQELLIKILRKITYISASKDILSNEKQSLLQRLLYILQVIRINSLKG
jgi:hypothetical protein